MDHSNNFYIVGGLIGSYSYTEYGNLFLDHPSNKGEGMPHKLVSTNAKSKLGRAYIN